MAVPLALFNLALRLLVKRRLAHLPDAEAFRRQLEDGAARFLRTPQGTHLSRDSIARPDPPGGRIDALWASAGRPDRRRVILYLHGGAYIGGSPDSHRGLGAALGEAAGTRVLLPDYRLAPEHPMPAATEDALAAYRFLLEKGIAPASIALAGDSAGGGLVFLLAARLALEGLPHPAALVAFSPWTDLSGSAESIGANAIRDPFLPASEIGRVSDAVRGQRPADDPELSPIHAVFERPAPALILASRDEILADDARAMARVLTAAGGDVQLEIWPRVPHGWPIFRGWLREADAAIATAGNFIARRMELAGESPDDQSPV